MRRIRIIALVAVLALMGGVKAQTAVPYVEGFEGMSTAADLTAAGWISYGSDADGVLKIETSNVMTGSKALDIDSYESSHYYVYQIVGLPVLDTRVNKLQITFSYKVKNGTVEVGYLTNASDASTFVSLQSFGSSDSYTTKTVELSAASSTAARIAIKYQSFWQCYIDDIEVMPIPTCSKPTGVAASSITKNSAIVTWEGEGSLWNLQYKADGDANWTAVNGLTAKSHTLTGLTSVTNYSVRVQNVCGDGTITGWTSATFTTTASIPFVEAFNTDRIPTGWARYKGMLSEVMGGTATLDAEYTSSSYWYFRDNRAQVDFWYHYCKEWLVTPTLLVEDNVELSFDMKLSSNTARDQADNKFAVLITTDGGSTWTILRQWDNVGSAYVYDDICSSGVGENVSFDLSSYVGRCVAVAFYAESNNSKSSSDLYIDNVCIDYISTCPRPSYPVVRNVTYQSAEVSWESDATDWQISLNDGEPIDVTGSPTYTLTGLVPETSNTVKVRTNCGGGNYGKWTSPTDFRTPEQFKKPYFLKSYNETNTTAMLSWVDNGNGATVAWKIGFFDSDDNLINAITVTENPYKLTGLTPSTKYIVNVRAVYADGESNWSYSNSFTTYAAYPKPVNLELEELTQNSATLNWSSIGDATSWEVDFNGTTTTITEKPYTLIGLKPMTQYVFKVRSIGGNGDKSAWAGMTFTTTGVPEIMGSSWSDDFEGSECGWQLINGNRVNDWAWGTAVSNGGTHALYISNDHGANHNYFNEREGTVYAAKLFHFDKGRYAFSYDWRAYGELYGDYLRVALVPATQTLAAGSSLSPLVWSNDGWKALDGGQKLNMSNTWQRKEVTVNVSGNYYLAFIWQNDSWSGEQQPAAIDNVRITRLPCEYVVDRLAVGNVSATEATLSWRGGDATQWQVAYSKNANFADATEVMVSNPAYTVTGFMPETTYYARVRSCCGDGDYGSWSETVSFEYSEKLVVGSGTDEFWDMPFDSRWKYTVSQQIYTATELGEAGKIRGIDFFCTSAQCTRKLDIYMVYTDKQSFENGSDWVNVTAADLVFSGDVTFLQNVWTKIYLDTPFEYNGESNVVIVVDDNTGIKANNTYFRVFGSSSQALSRDSSIDIDPTDMSGVLGTLGVSGKNQIRLLKGEAPDVMKPVALTVSCTGTNAVLRWTQPDGATRWVVAYKSANSTTFEEFETDGNVGGDSQSPWCSLASRYLYTDTDYEVKVRAMNVKDNAVSEWSPTVSFKTDRCEEMCVVNVTLTDAGGNGWEGNVMKLVDKVMFEDLYELTLENGSRKTYTLKVCSGAEIGFDFEPTGTNSYECGYIITDVNDDLIHQFEGSTIPPIYSGINTPEGEVASWMVDCTIKDVRKPTNLAATEATTNSVVLSWTDNCLIDVTSWVVKYKRDGDVSYTEVTTSNNPFTLENLRHGAEYSFMVRPVNSESIEKWSDIATFATIDANPMPTDMAVSNITPTSATVSWTGRGNSYKVQYRTEGQVADDALLEEGFESGDLPEGWTIDGPGKCYIGTGDFYSETGAHNGNNNIIFSHVQKGNRTYLISPEMNLSGQTDPVLSFWYINRSWGGDTDGLSVYYTVNDGDWIELWSTTEQHKTWTKQTIPLKVRAGRYQIAFKMIDNDGYGVGLDDIAVASVMNDEWSEVDAVGTSIGLGDLVSGTTYECRVQSLKDGEESDWSSIAAFTTMLQGDANGDGKVTMTDVKTVLEYILTNGNLTGKFAFEAADVNGDKQITITDASIISILTYDH